MEIQSVLSVVGIVNVLFMFILSFFLSTMRSGQRDTKDAMQQIVIDLKKLNDAVLGDYAKKADLEGIRSEIARVDEVRRKSAHELRSDMHRLELAIVKHGIEFIQSESGVV